MHHAGSSSPTETPNIFRPPKHVQRDTGPIDYLSGVSQVPTKTFPRKKLSFLAAPAGNAVNVQTDTRHWLFWINPIRNSFQFFFSSALRLAREGNSLTIVPNKQTTAPSCQNDPTLLKIISFEFVIRPNRWKIQRPLSLSFSRYFRK